MITKNLDNYILTAAERSAELRPALLFNGNMSEHRARTLFCLTQFMRDNNIKQIGLGRKLIDEAIDERHRAGSHAAKQDGMTWARWLSRMKAAPKIFALDPQLKDYVNELYESVPWRNRFALTPIPDTNMRSHRDWRRPAKLLPTLSHYPYSHENLSNNLLWLVHNAVPKHLPEEVRADVCQDMIVSVLAGEISRLNLGSAVRLHLKRHRKLYADQWRTISMETPIYDRDGGELPITLRDYLRD